MEGNLGTKQTFASYANVFAFMGSWRSARILALLQISIFSDGAFQKEQRKVCFYTQFCLEDPKHVVSKQYTHLKHVILLSLISVFGKVTSIEVHYNSALAVPQQTLTEI